MKKNGHTSNTSPPKPKGCPCVILKARLRRQIFSSEYTEGMLIYKKSKASSKFEGWGRQGQRNGMELKTHFFLKDIVLENHDSRANLLSKCS